MDRITRQAVVRLLLQVVSPVCAAARALLVKATTQCSQTCTNCSDCNPLLAVCCTTTALAVLLPNSGIGNKSPLRRAFLFNAERFYRSRLNPATICLPSLLLKMLVVCGAIAAGIFPSYGP